MFSGNPETCLLIITLYFVAVAAKAPRKVLASSSGSSASMMSPKSGQFREYSGTMVRPKFILFILEYSGAMY